MADDYDDKDTVVVRDSGSSAGMILGILAVIIVLAGLWYFAMGPGSGGGTTTQENKDESKCRLKSRWSRLLRDPLHHLDDAPDDVGRVVRHHERP